jgi:hypothetical protein
MFLADFIKYRSAVVSIYPLPKCPCQFLMVFLRPDRIAERYPASTASSVQNEGLGVLPRFHRQF